MSFVDERPSRMQGQLFFEVGRDQTTFFWWVQKLYEMFLGVCQPWAPVLILAETPPRKVRRGRINVRLINVAHEQSEK